MEDSEALDATVRTAKTRSTIWERSRSLPEPRELKKKPRRVRFSARTYRCASTLNMDGRDLDPSMALGFYCRAESDFDELCLELELMSTRAGSTPICTVCRKGDEDEKAPPSVKATAAGPSQGSINVPLYS